MVEVNKIYCGDCLEIMKRIEDQSVDMILTDPPYLINFQSNHRKEKHERILNDNGNFDLIKESMKEFYRVLKDNTSLYIFCSWHNIDFFKQEFEKYFKLKNIIVWNKNNTSMGDLKGSYAPKHEFILFGHKGRRLLEGYRFPDVIDAKRTGNKHHPTEKPIELLEIFIKSTSKEKEIILDPFLGSASTAIAALKSNRFFIGIEKVKKYYEIADERIKNFLKNNPPPEKFEYFSTLGER